MDRTDAEVFNLKRRTSPPAMTRGFSFLKWESRRAGTYGSLLSDRHGLLRGRLVLVLGLVPRGCKRARPVELRPQQPRLPPHLAATATATVPVSHAARAARPQPLQLRLGGSAHTQADSPPAPPPTPRGRAPAALRGHNPNMSKTRTKPLAQPAPRALSLSLATLF